MSLTDRIDGLLEDLRSNDKTCRRQAAEILGDEKADAALEALIAAFKDDDAPVREAAGEAVARIGGEKAITGLLPLLRQEKEFVRNLSCEILESIGLQYLDPIISLLEDPDHDVRKFIADILGNVGSGKAVPALIKALSDKHSNVLTSVIESLGKLKDESAADALIGMLKGELAFESALALGKIRSKKALGPLMELAKDDASFARYGAIEAIGRIGDKSIIPELAGLIDVRDVTLQKSILKAIGNIDQTWIEEGVESFKSKFMDETLISALEDSDDEVRYYAIKALGYFDIDKCTVKLISMLAYDEDELIPYIVNSLVRIGRRDATKLLEAVKSDSDNIRKFTALVLGDVQNKAAVPVLMEKAADKDVLVRAASVRALGKLSDEKALDVLMSALEDDEEMVRKAAADALGWLGDEWAIEGLFNMLGDVSKDVGESAIGALIMIGGDKAKKLILGALGDDSKQVRALISYGLGVIGGREATDALKVALNDEDWEVRKLAVNGLAKLGRDKQVVDRIRLCIGDTNSRVRTEVLSALVKISGEESMDLFMQSLQDVDIWVRYKAAKCLGEIKSRRSVDGLLEQLPENQGFVQAAICEALASIGDKKVTMQLQDVLATLKRSQDEELKVAILMAIEKLK